ncbi:MAG: M4 family metallopeptidase [Pseudomonadota bacterium]|nr:M4 family metallopeptidase [Pseudomonadota bacterium]
MTMRITLLTVTIACGAFTALAQAAPLTVPAAQIAKQLNAGRAARGLDQDHGFLLVQQHPGTAGTEVVRAIHTYKGVPLFGSESVLVVDPQGKILAESRAERRQHLGRGSSNKLRGLTTNFTVTPVITPTVAIGAALASLPAASRHVRPPVAELIIYPIMATRRVPAAANKPEQELNALDLQEEVDRYALSYLVHTRMQDGDRPVYHDTVVDARSGAIVDQWSMLQTVVGLGYSQYSGAVALSTSATASGFQMIDPVRGTGGAFGGMAITNADHGTSAGKVYTNASNTWGDGKQYVNGGSTTDANGQTAAVNALWGLMNTYDMLKNVLGWSSLDGKNTATYIATHVNSSYDNAYYSDTCGCMFIGDGASFNSLGAIDVIGHEMGHGVTAATSDLVYSGESGGLNESSSDINGEATEAYARAGGKGDRLPADGNDWMIGTEISKNGEPLRWMVKPSRDGASPDAWSTALKRLDVHYSSGPNNRMFNFLAQGSSADQANDAYSKYLLAAPHAMHGVGLDTAYRIWFRAATTKFTSTTNYAVARAKLLEAAQELYGKDSREAIAVQRAYAAINVGLDVAE